MRGTREIFLRLPIAVVACIGLSMTVWGFLAIAYEELPWAWTGVLADQVLGTLYMAVSAGFAVYVASKIAERWCYLFALISLLSHLPLPIVLYLLVAGPEPFLLVYPVSTAIAGFGMAFILTRRQRARQSRVAAGEGEGD